jgi:prepilin-type N-terminal cleavage/methylation domain-containing protein
VNASSLPRPPLARRIRLRSAGGFTLVELMVVVTIISLLFLTAVPTYRQIQRKARASTIANDFRVYAGVFQAYAHENGSWPPEAAAGVVPIGISPDEIKVDAWSAVTPIGGKFDWEYNQLHPGGTSPDGRVRAAIAITGTADAPLLIDADMMEMIDRELDDGNLATGSFRLGFGDCPLYIIEP